MAYTAEEFARIVGPEVTLANKSRSGIEDRRAKRVEQRMRVEIALRQLDGQWRIEQAQVRNCSARGICILRGEPLKAGTQFITTSPNSEGNPTRILTTVVHCRLMAKGVFAIGSEFTCTLGKQTAADAQIDMGELDRIRAAVLAEP